MNGTPLPPSLVEVAKCDESDNAPLSDFLKFTLSLWNSITRLCAHHVVFFYIKILDNRIIKPGESYVKGI